MKQFYIILLLLQFQLISFAQSKNLSVAYENSTNCKVNKLKFLLNGNINIIDTSLSKTDKYKIISFYTEFVDNARVISNVNYNGKIKYKTRKNALKYSIDKNLYLKSIKAVNKLTNDTIRLNSILINFSGKSKIKKSITFNSNIFFDTVSKTISLSYLQNLTEIPIVGDKLELVSYNIICNYTKQFSSNSHTIPKEFIDLIIEKKIRAPMQIFFTDIIVKDLNGNLYEIPMRSFVLTSE